MKYWSFYDAKTGRLLGSGGSFKDEAMLRANLPEGAAAIEGRHDHESQRVDVDAGAVVDRVPPQPSEHHVWDVDDRRWVLTREAFALAQAHDSALRKISDLEGASLRRVRELLLTLTNDAALRAVDAQIEAQRPAIVSGKAPADARNLAAPAASRDPPQG